MSNKSLVNNMFHKNGRALGSMGYFALLMLVFLINSSIPSGPDHFENVKIDIVVTFYNIFII